MDPARELTPFERSVWMAVYWIYLAALALLALFIIGGLAWGALAASQPLGKGTLIDLLVICWLCADALILAALSIAASLRLFGPRPVHQVTARVLFWAGFLTIINFVLSWGMFALSRGGSGGLLMIARLMAVGLAADAVVVFWIRRELKGLRRA